MKKGRISILALLLAAVVQAPVAVAATAVPYTFTDGQPASAAQVNADFATLAAQIDQLQAQVTALKAQLGKATASSIVGTYDFVMFSLELQAQAGAGGTPHVTNSFSIFNHGAKGSVVFGANGTMNYSESGWGAQMDINNDVSTVSQVGNGGSVVENPSKSLIYISQSTVGSLGNENGGPFPYTISGNAVTVTHPNGELKGTLSADGGMLILTMRNTSGETGIMVALKRH